MAMGEGAHCDASRPDFNTSLCQNPVYMQADTLGLSAFAPVNSGNVHSDVFPEDASGAVNVSGSAIDPYLWRGTSMVGGGIHSSEAFWKWVQATEARLQVLRDAVAERRKHRAGGAGLRFARPRFERGAGRRSSRPLVQRKSAEK